MAKQQKKGKAGVVEEKIPLVQPKPVALPQVKEPHKGLVLLLCFALSLIFYGNTIPNRYSMDDELVTLTQVNVEKGFAGIKGIITSRYSVNTKQSYEYRPIVLITYAIEYQFFGRNAGVSHFINLLLYAISAFLVYLVIKKMFIHHHWILPLLSSLIFIVLPVHSEVVASLKNRDEILALIFGLLALHTALNMVDRKHWRLLPLVLVYMTLAILSKKSSVGFLFIIPFTLAYVRGVSRKIIVLVIATIALSPVILRLIAFSALERIALQREVHFFENPLFIGDHGFLERIFYIVSSFGYYVKMMFVPYPLSAYYGYNTFDGGTFGIYHVIGLVAGLGALYLMIKFWKKDKVIVMGIFMFIISIAMFLNFPIPLVGIIGERFAYEASVGFSILLAAVLLHLFKIHKPDQKESLKRIPSKLSYTFFAIALACALIVIPRNNDWYDHLTLYKQDAKNFPQSTKLFSLLGTIHTNTLNDHMELMSNPQATDIYGDPVKRLTEQEVKAHTDSAISYFRKAYQIYPNYTAVLNNLGTIYYSYKPMLDSAGYFFSRAIELDTDYVEANYNIGSFYEQKAEIAAVRLKWLKAVAQNNVVETNAKDPAQSLVILNEYNDKFVKMTTLKNNLMNAFRMIGTGKVSGDPRETLIQTLLRSIAEVPELRKIKWGHDSLANGIVGIYELATKTGKASGLQEDIDSIVNKYYFPAFVTIIVNDKKLTRQDLNRALVNEAKEEVKQYRTNAYLSMKKALRINLEYTQAYSKLMQVLGRWEMYDEMISVHQMVLKSDKYRSYGVYFSMADAYYEKGDYQKAAENLITALKHMEKVMKRLNLVAADFSKVQNPKMIMAISGSKDANKNNMGYYVQKMMPTLTAKQPYEAMQINQLSNIIMSL